jgi:hypothetical protein
MRSRCTRLVPVILACQCVAGCGTIGPRTMSRDQFNYSASVSDSWKKQMLLNLVKLRYNDAPVFLEVASIISQYSLETSLSAGISWNAFLPTDSESLGTAGRYTDRPTITYSPMRGEQFTRSMMTPIPPASLCALVQAGWPVDRVFQTCVQSINGLDNGTGTMALGRQGDPDFYRLLAALRRIQQAGGVTVRVEKRDDRTVAVMLLDSGADDSVRADVQLVRTLLGVNPSANEYELVYGRLARTSNEVAILSRSMLQILLEIATGVDVPQADLDEGRVMPVLVQTAAEQAGLLPGIRIHSGSRAPEDAFVSVTYRGYGFWIGDRDPRSKGTLSFLMILFSLTETGEPSRAPLVTIPAG